MRRSGLWFLVGALPILVLAGCGGVRSDHALSTAADSVVDERLIGWWEQIPDATKAHAGTAQEPQMRFLIGRLADTDNTLELVAMKLEPDDTVTVERRRIYTIRLGDTWHVTLVGEDEDTFAIARYRIDDDGALTLEGLDERLTAKAIEEGTIEGRVARNPEHTGPLSAARMFKEVRLTAGTAALRAWIAKAGTAAFARADKPFIRKLPFPRPGHSGRAAK